MRYLRKLYSGLLILSMVFLMAGQTVRAADEEAYTYTVRLYAGNQGTLNEKGIEIDGSGKISSSSKDEIVISGLMYGDEVHIYAQDAAAVKDARYYVKGVRRSGRDNSEATESAFYVASDRDYVIAYGIKGNMVAYTVNYLDENGNSLLPSNTYYGEIGERQYVAARYVDGYQPETLNLVKTLSANEAENVFDFRYTRGIAGVGGTTTGTVTTTTEETTTTTTAGGAGAGAAGAGADADTDEADTGEEAVGGDFVDIPDEGVPQANLRDLDDGEVPLSNFNAGGIEGVAVLGRLPIYAGIGTAAAFGFLMSVVCLKRRHKIAAAKPSDDEKKS